MDAPSRVYFSVVPLSLSDVGLWWQTNMWKELVSEMASWGEETSGHGKGIPADPGEGRTLLCSEN